MRDKHVRLLGRLRRTARSGQGVRLGSPENRGPEGVDANGRLHRALDWRAVQARLSPVRHRWDLAILCHLNDAVGCRPAGLVAAINSEASNGRQLSPQVLSGRLRELERGGYVRHEDVSLMPLRRLYYLQPPGQALIGDLLRIMDPAQAGVATGSAR